jgi:phage tail protein X
MNAYIVSQDGERLDLICWRWYGTLDGRIVERVLDLNPGLADKNPANLPAGTRIAMPQPVKQRPAPRVF